jgi:hypothetical protein
VNLIVNVSSFQSFESLAKKLFLVSDTLVLRDARKWTQEELGNRTIPIPIEDYRPGYYEDLIDDLRKLRPSPLTLLYRPNLYMSSTTKKLNNGYEVYCASCDYNSIPNEIRKLDFDLRPELHENRNISGNNQRNIGPEHG